LAVASLGFITALPDNIMIGGVFDESNKADAEAFELAVKKINQDRYLLPRSTVTGLIEKESLEGSYETSKKVCEFLREGVTAIVGPSSPNSAPHVQSICNTKELPHIEGGLEANGNYSINLLPSPSTLNQAFSSLLSALEWHDYLLLYEDSNRLPHLQGLLENNDAKVTIRKLDAKSAGNDYRSQLMELKKVGHRRIVLDCSSESLHHILSQAQQVGMMTDYQTYVVTSLDLHTVNLEDFRYSEVRIIGLQLVDPNSEEYQDAGRAFKAQSAAIYDGLFVWAKALTLLGRSQNIEASHLDCQTDSFWQYGNSLINTMKLVDMKGLSGKIQFDTSGARKDFKLDVVELSINGLNSIGTWDPENGAQILSSIENSVTSPPKKNLIVSAVLNDPFMMLKEDSEVRDGNDRYEGYSADLLEEISRIIGLNYTIKLVADGTYGRYDDKKKEWSGMIGELQSLEADLAVADMVITQERSKVIDFSMPFMNLGITILYKKSTYASPNLFAFLDPFTFDLWMYIFLAYIIVSSLLYIISRFNPNENKSTVKDTNRLEDHPVEGSTRKEVFTAMNSFWFILASLLAQRVDFLPRALSTRMIAAMWWFFVMVMVSAYTANLAGWLSAKTIESPIESADDLAQQNTIRYGAVHGGSTSAFFKDSKISTYARIWDKMNDNKNVFTRSTKEGVERVLQDDGKYAFFAESTTVEYLVERRCDLKQVGGLLDYKSYGIGVPKNSPYLNQINNALLQLQENGRLTLLKRKWWYRMRGGGACSKEPTYQGPYSLTIENFGGVFILLLAGLVLACLTACFECLWVWHKKKSH